MSLCTEEEARKSRCCGPHGCGHWEYEPMGNMAPDEGCLRYCIASQCMAWRWSDETIEAGGKDMTDAQHADWKGRRTGFCGLAAKP